MATLTSDYSRYSGVKNTLSVNMDELRLLECDGNEVRIAFGGLDEHHVSGYVPQSDLEDKSKYWKTEELVTQLESWRDWLKKVGDNYKTSDSIHGLQCALQYQLKRSILDEIITCLRDGEDVWDLSE